MAAFRYGRRCCLQVFHPLGLWVVTLHRVDDVQRAIDFAIGQNQIEILLDTTKRPTGTTILVVYSIFALIFCATDLVATSNRQLFSFARDRDMSLSSPLCNSEGRERRSIQVKAGLAIEHLE